VIVLSFALPEESSGIVRRLAGAARSGSAALPVIAGTLAGREVVVVHTGMGMASATARLETFLDERAPSIWIASGFGGALAGNLRVGDIVASRNFSDASLLDSIAPLAAHTGILITTVKVVETSLEKEDLARHTGAIAVDMETAAIRRFCEARGIPLLAVRAISDTAGQNLPVPAAVWFDTARQRPRPVSLLLYLAIHPARIAPFIAFVRGIGRARTRLTDFLLAVLDLLPEK
jgi:adenosylhomocysteine nucleosidase